MDTPPPFAPQNRLEELLLSAAKDPGDRPEFYRTLLDSQLVILARVAGPEGERVAGQNERMQVGVWQIDGRPMVPVFTSVERLSSVLREPQQYVQMKGRALFESLKGAEFILNPGHAAGKRFDPEEIAMLLDGSLLAPPEGRTVPAGRRVLIGAPAKAPEALVKALKTFFGRHPAVVSAHLAQMHEEGSSEPPSLLVGVEVDVEGVFEGLMGEVGVVVSGAHPGQPVDFAPLPPGPKEGLLGAVAALEPFYRR